MLLGMIGKAQSGKTTAAEVFVREGGFKRVRFADPIKKMVRQLLISAQIPEDQTWEYLDGDLREEPIPVLNGVTARYLMQTLGTEWGRMQVGPYLWLNLTKEEIQRHLNSGYNVIVDDVRFLNEVNLLRGMGGRIVEVQRPGLPETPTYKHASEKQKLNYDVAIFNTGTKDQFEQEVKRFMDEVVLSYTG